MAQIQSGAGSDLLTVDPTSKAARASLYSSGGLNLDYGWNDVLSTANTRGFLGMGMNDSRVVPNRADRFGGLALALHQMLFTDSFEQNTINPLRWTISQLTMTASQSSVAGVTFNSGSIVTASTGYLLKSARSFLKLQRSPLHVKKRLRIAKQNNAVGEWGFGDSTAYNVNNTTGAYWQCTSGGAIQPVLTFNGVDQTGIDIAASINSAKFYVWDIVLDDDSATFFCQDAETSVIVSRQVIPLTASQQRLWSSTQLYDITRLFITATAAPAAPVMVLTDTYIAGLDVNYNRPWADTMAAVERSAVANPATGAQYPAWTNSAEPASATLSNTAAGYTTLGGKFQFAAVAGAVTDYALFGVQIPVPFNFNITGVDIDTWNTGAAVATSATLLTWALGLGSTAVSLATAGMTRVGLGAQSFAIGAAVGACAPRISKQYRTPLFVPAGRWVHLILRMPVGTATASQVIAGMANIEGYFD